MFSLFKKEKENKKDENHLSLTSVAALLIHSAKIDLNFTEKERNIIKKALIEMGADEDNLDGIIKEAEEKEIIDYAETEDLNIFYEDYIDNLKYQAEILQEETNQAISKFEGTYNISYYMKDEG